jgi:tetratricopeptide (TPR) repeat protein
MNDRNKETKQDDVLSRIKGNIKKYLFDQDWANYVKVICVIVAILLIIAVVIKLARPAWLAEANLEVLLLALAIAISLPYISSIKALGVEVGLKVQVKGLSDWTEASPYYYLASEYQAAKDYSLAEKYYLKSLDKCPTFWPSILGLASVYDEPDFNKENPDWYCKAIDYYQKVIELNKDNIYSYNNLAAVYLQAPEPVYNPQEALKNANKALEIWQAFPSACYYKGVALNYLNRYQEAHDILQSIIDNNWLEDDKHWVMYDLVIAKSKLGIPVTKDDLNEMFKYASKADEADQLAKFLSPDQDLKRFSESDQTIIKQFLTKMKKKKGSTDG